jgi:GR25 family glycosyltransferase involved in LPS biosynthesis
MSKIISDYRKAGFKVVISLTTNPLRIKYVNKIIKQLNYEFIDYIQLNIPKVFPRMKDIPYVISNELKSNRKLKINVISTDLGPATKIVPTLQSLKRDGDIGVSIDDDSTVPKKVMIKIIEQCIQHDCVSTGLGKNLSFWKLKRQEPFQDKLESTQFVDLIEGWTGVAYKKKMVNPELVSLFIKSNKKCLMGDDLTLSAIVKISGYRIMSWKGYSGPSSQNKEALMFKEQPWSHGSDAIHMGAGVGQVTLGHENGGEDAHYDNYKVCLSTINSMLKTHKKEIAKILKNTWHRDIDKLMIISVKKNKERRKAILSCLKKCGFPKEKISVFNAVTPNNYESASVPFRKVVPTKLLSSFGIKKLFAPSLQSRMEKGGSFAGGDTHDNMYWKKTTGLSLGHLRCMEECLVTQQNILILEDDACPSDSFYDQNAFKSLRKLSWDMIYFGDCYRLMKAKRMIKWKENSIIKTEYPPMCTHAMFIKPDFVKKMMARVKKVKLNREIDDFLINNMDDANVNYYGFEKNLFVQNIKFDSDLQDQMKTNKEKKNELLAKYGKCSCKSW